MTKPSLNRPRTLVVTDGRIASHLRCIKCKYDLKGMAEDTACPECGRAVSESVDAMTAPFPWTRSQRGVSAATILLGVVLPILNVLAYPSSLLQFAGYWLLLVLAWVLLLTLAAFHRRFTFWCLLIMSLALLEGCIAVVLNLILWGQVMASI